MITCKNLYDNKNVEVISSKGGVKVLEYKKDLSVDAASAINAYFASEMNVRKRQVLIELNGNAYTISAGSMQWTAGSVKMAADVKGIGDFFGNFPTGNYDVLPTIYLSSDVILNGDGSFNNPYVIIN